jgi:hypothetical protein
MIRLSLPGSSSSAPAGGPSPQDPAPVSEPSKETINRQDSQQKSPETTIQEHIQRFR